MIQDSCRIAFLNTAFCNADEYDSTMNVISAATFMAIVPLLVSEPRSTPDAGWTAGDNNTSNARFRDLQ